MTTRPSRWKAQHVGCQKAVDNVKADLTKEIERYRTAIEDLYHDCLNRASYVKGNVGEELESVANKLSDLLESERP